MAFSSADISGMVGGQMAMFSNQAQFSQQIGGTVGTSPMGMSGGSMQNPYPSENIGSKVAGGMGMALPGIATGASLAGGLMGGRLGMLDPFTMAGRGFATGAGISGGGLGATLGHVGRTFATGGLRAGLGVMGGGLAAGAGMMALPLAAGIGLQFAGQNIYEGAQNISQVGGMAQQYMGPQFGVAGSRPGGQFGRESIKGMVGALHELVGEEGTATMKELKGLMDQAGRMGMLTGISDVQGFKNKMKDMVRQVKSLSDIMGVTMAEAGPMLGQMRQMGLWKTQDIMGTAIAMKGETAATAGAMLGGMQAGAGMSYQMGGTRRAGAMMGQQSFLTMQNAVRSGALSEEDIQEFTGGLGGAEGQMAAGNKITGIMAQYGRTDLGRAMMLATGEMKGGKFTGEIDKARMSKWMQGGSTDEMLREGRARVGGSREAAASFERYANKMGENLAAEGGPEAALSRIQKIVDEKFQGSETMRHHLIKQMMSVDDRDAEMLGRLSDKMPQIRDREMRDAEAKAKRAFEEAERKNLRSMEALGRSAEIMFEQVKRPFQEFGESIATSVSSMVDNISEKIAGYSKTIPMAASEKARLIRSGALTQDLSKFSVPAMSAKEWAASSPLANINLAMREQGSALKATGGAVAGMVAGAALGSFGGPLGTVLGGMVGAGLGAAGVLGGLGVVGNPRERYLQNIGVDAKASGKDMAEGIAMAVKRYESPDRKSMGIENEDKLGEIKARLSSVLANNSKEMEDLKKSDPQGYTQALLRKMENDGKSHIFAGMTEKQKLNYLAAAQAEEHIASDLTADLRGDVARIGYINTAKGAQDKQNELIADLSKLTGVNTEQMTRVMTSGTGSDVMAALAKGDITKEQAAQKLIGVEGAGEAREVLGKLGDREAVTQFQKLGSQFAGVRAWGVQLETLEGIRAATAKGTANLEGLRAGTKSQFSKLLETYKGKDEGGHKVLGHEAYAAAQEMTEQMARGGLTDEEKKALVGGGGAAGRQVVAESEALGLKTAGGLSGEQVKKLNRQFGDLGYNLESQGSDRMKELLAGGDLGRKEAMELKGEILKITKTMTGDRETAKSVTDEYQARIDYIQKNKEFVNAVAHVLGKDLTTAAAAEAVTDSGKEQTPTGQIKK